MDKLKTFLFMYEPFRFSHTIAYMFQSTEYQVRPYLKWVLTTTDFRHVMKRRELDKTTVAKLLRSFVLFGLLFSMIACIVLGLLCLWNQRVIIAAAFVVLFSFLPFVWAVAVSLPTAIARKVLIEPKLQRMIDESKQIFSATKAIKIVVAGSYGKTSMKELLGTVLSQGKNVAITPANKNVASSHAQFAKSLKGDEEVLVIELGEGEPGDVARFCETIKPDIAIITGLAPAHLDHYKDLADAAADIMSVRTFVEKDSLYVNGDSERLVPYIKESDSVYSFKDAKNIKLSVTGTDFDISDPTLHLQTALLGRHNIGPIIAAVRIATKLGIDRERIRAGVANTLPYEHRMQPRALQGGAWIIDDTYNGTIEGMQAGLQLLSELEARRKWYVTPGLVDQGVENERVHTLLGEKIAEASPDIVVLMKNSVTDYILSAMSSRGFSGEVRIEEDPLHFYTNLDQLVASGDLVLMQNDWTDNYS
jgi:UDP-N-acetylmuramoyl-tripeptide--D-alanyl-D-alanine ligase